MEEGYHICPHCGHKNALINDHYAHMENWCDKNKTMEEQKDNSDIKMMLFARWVSMCYADTHIDSKKISQHEEGFDPSDAMSVLNREDGYWWKDQLKHFNEVVYPNYVKNGSVSDAEKFLEENYG